MNRHYNCEDKWRQCVSHTESKSLYWRNLAASKYLSDGQYVRVLKKEKISQAQKVTVAEEDRDLQTMLRIRHVFIIAKENT